MSKLTLVGAGPGDPDLITVKAIKALKKADVVLYDALASEELLEYCQEDCIKVYVGKRAGMHTHQQVYINEMIVAYGQKHEAIVRLKGGDPFVFGRGHEEMDHAQVHGMETEMVPGISSCVAVPAAIDIPITKRGYSESFWVITGTTKSLELSGDVALAARSSATIVILMGMKKLGRIIETYQSLERGSLPIAIIQHGTTSKQKMGVGTIDTIQHEVERLGLSSPAIIVIGEVVRANQELNAIIEEMSSDQMLQSA
ncbi:MAG: uroporphyrinogen-III C-methyltransferase [Cytophagales bacterium]|nr:uroporphyrinogen-III C-methyltransferase [Cytophagales bacterium]